MKSKLIILGEAILSLIIFKDIFFEKIKKKKWRKKDAGQIEIRIMENKDGWGFFFFFFWFSFQAHKIYSSNKGKGGRKIGR